MAEDLLFYSRDQVIEMLDYLARGMTGYMIPSGTSPADEKDQPLPADEIMIEFTDRVRRIKSLCELDGLWPPRRGVLVELGDPDLLPRMQLTRAEPAAKADTPGAVPLGEVKTLTRTLRYMLGLSELPAAGLTIVRQLEGILPRAIQLGDGWRLVSAGGATARGVGAAAAGAAAAGGAAKVRITRATAGAAAASAAVALRPVERCRRVQRAAGMLQLECRRLNKCSTTCSSRSASSEALLRLFGKLNAWDVEDVRHLSRAVGPRQGRAREVYKRGRRLGRAFSGCDLFRYHRTDPCRPLRPDKYGDWHIVEIDVD